MILPTLSVTLLLFGATIQCGQPCGLPPFKASNSAKEIKASLTNIVNFSNKKTVEMENQKKGLEAQMLSNEKTSVQLAAEKAEKTKRSGNLKATSDSLTKSISLQQTNKKNLEGQLWTTNQQLSSTNQKISATQTSINSLQSQVNSLNAQVKAAEAQINKEAAKRKCIFGLGKRRRRRNAQPQPWRRRIRLRVRGRRIVRGVVRVVRETGRIIRQVVRLPKCVVDQVLSRLKRTKEDAERRKNNAWNQLVATRTAHTNAVAEKNRLNLKKNQLTADVSHINTKLSQLQNSLNTSNKDKAAVDTEIASISKRLGVIKSSIAQLEGQIRDLRERKTRTLQVISELKSEAQDKVDDLKEIKDASVDELEDLLEDLKEINENIETSVVKLRKLVCYT